MNIKGNGRLTMLLKYMEEQRQNIENLISDGKYMEGWALYFSANAKFLAEKIFLQPDDVEQVISKLNALYNSLKACSKTSIEDTCTQSSALPGFCGRDEGTIAGTPVNSVLGSKVKPPFNMVAWDPINPCSSLSCQYQKGKKSKK